MSTQGATQREYRHAHIHHVMEELNITRKQYTSLLLLGNKLHTIYERSCNGYTGDNPVYQGKLMVNRYTDEMYEADTKPLYEKAINLCKSLGLHVYFQTDPRGATIYVDNKPISDTAYTNAHCIY